MQMTRRELFGLAAAAVAAPALAVAGEHSVKRVNGFGEGMVQFAISENGQALAILWQGDWEECQRIELCLDGAVTHWAVTHTTWHLASPDFIRIDAGQAAPYEARIRVPKDIAV